MIKRTGKQRLGVVQRRLIRCGVKDVKFFFAPGFEKQPINKIFSDAASLLESYLKGDYKVVNEYGP